MDEQTKIADLTVAQFRALMQQCFDADRKAVLDRSATQAAAHHHYRTTGEWPPQPWDEWFRSRQQREAGFFTSLFGGPTDER